MNLNGRRKAAMLLMSLDQRAATELLRSAEGRVLTEIAAEIVHLDRAGQVRSTELVEPVREFAQLLRARRTEPSSEEYLERILGEALGDEQSRRVLDEARSLAQMRDPFLPIRTAEAEELSAALAGESPQVAAMVLGELSPRKSAHLLSLLDEEIRPEVIRCMTAEARVSAETRLRVARLVQDRLESARNRGAATATDSGAGQLRKVSVLLRGLDTEFRNRMLGAVCEQNPEVGDQVEKLMVTWEDLPLVSERSLQNILRTVDSRKLALALQNAEQSTIDRVRENISERANAMLEEEMSLLSSPNDEEVATARESILDALREINSQGDLEFEDDEE